MKDDLLARAIAPQSHLCAGCGLRWEDLPGAELCGDCWRKVQPVLHGPARAIAPPDNWESALEGQIQMAEAVIGLAGTNALHDEFFKGKAAGIRQVLDGFRHHGTPALAIALAPPEQKLAMKETFEQMDVRIAAEVRRDEIDEGIITGDGAAELFQRSHGHSARERARIQELVTYSRDALVYRIIELEAMEGEASISQPCKVCGGGGFIAVKRSIDDGMGEVDSCPACAGEASVAPPPPQQENEKQ